MCNFYLYILHSFGLFIGIRRYTRINAISNNNIYVNISTWTLTNSEVSWLLKTKIEDRTWDEIWTRIRRLDVSQPAITCSKLLLEILEEGVKYVQNYWWRPRNDAWRRSGVLIVNFEHILQLVLAGKYRLG